MATRGKNSSNESIPADPEVISTPSKPPTIVASTPILEPPAVILSTAPTSSTGWTPEVVSRLIGLAVIGQVAALMLAVVGTLCGYYAGLQGGPRESGRSPIALTAPPSLEPGEPTGRVADRRPGRDDTIVRAVASRPAGPTWSVPGVRMGVSTRVHVLGGTMRHDAVYLDGTDIHDSDLAILQRLPALSSINLDRTPITDSGLKALEPIKTLRLVSLVGDKGISPRAVESLKAAIPGVQVIQGP